MRLTTKLGVNVLLCNVVLLFLSATPIHAQKIVDRIAARLCSKSLVFRWSLVAYVSTASALVTTRFRPSRFA